MTVLSRRHRALALMTVLGGTALLASLLTAPGVLAAGPAAGGARWTPRAASPWTWGAAVTLSPSGQPSIDPQIAVSSNGMIQTAAWSQSGAWYIVNSSTSRDGGVTWDPAVAHSRAGYQGVAPSLAMSSNGQTQGIAWTDGFGGINIVRFVRTLNAGVSWDDSTALTSLSSYNESPRLAMSADGTVMSAAWATFSSEWQIQTRRSLTSGASWDANVRLSAVGSTGFTPWVAVSASGRLQSTLWTTPNAPLIRTSDDSGATWQASVALGPVAGTVGAPQITTSADGLRQLAVWQRLVSGLYVIQVSASADGGVTWSSPVDLSATGGDASKPRMAISADGMIQTVAWHRSNGSNTIVQSRTSTDGGATWSAVQEHSAAGADSQNAQVAMSSDGTSQSIAFSTNTGAQSNLRVATSDTSGSTWDSAVTVSTVARQFADARLAMSQDGTHQTVAFRAVVGSDTFIQTISASRGSSPTPPPGPVVTPPSPPLSVVAEPGDAEATVTWATPESAGSSPISHYRVTSSPGDRECVVEVPALSCTLPGLVNGTPYTFTVRALSFAGGSSPSGPSNVVIPRRQLTPAVVIVGTREGSRITISGETTDLGQGAVLEPWLRLSGQADFAKGSARILVSADGTFTWGRRTNKSASVYVATPDGAVRSNTVRIAAA